MNTIAKFFTGAKNIQRSSYVWNMISCTSNSFQSLLLLLIVSRFGSAEDAAIFTISFSVATLMLFVGKYGVRNFQVSDINQEFSLEDYKRNRIVTTIIMSVTCVVYIVWGFFWKDYTFYKCMCMLTLMGPRIIESMEDVFHGHLQQKGRLDISAKIWGIRTILYMISFGIIYIITRDLLVTGIFTCILTIILCVLFNLSVKELFDKGVYSGNTALISLFKKCFSIALSTTLISYITNAPKYAIDGVVSNQEQVNFGIIFMFVFVMSLLGSYIFNPMVGKLSAVWQEENKRAFLRVIIMNIGIVCIITFVVIVAGESIGLRILELLYKVELSDYVIHLLFMIISGGLLTLLNFTIMVATVVRQQEIIKTYLILGTVLWLIFNKYALNNYGLLGVVIFFTCILFAVLLLIEVGLYHKIKTS